MNAIELKKSDSIGELTMSGKLTVVQAHTIRKTLLAALTQVECVVLDLGKSTEVDLSFLQLLCSAHRTAVKAQRNVKISNPSTAFTNQASAAGFFRHCRCPFDTGNSCLWGAGGEYVEEQHEHR